MPIAPIDCIRNERRVIMYWNPLFTQWESDVNFHKKLTRTFVEHPLFNFELGQFRGMSSFDEIDAFEGASLSARAMAARAHPIWMI